MMYTIVLSNNTRVCVNTETAAKAISIAQALAKREHSTVVSVTETEK